MNKQKVEELYNIAASEFNNHIKKIHNSENPMIMISNAYPGVWLEHLYDSIIYGNLFNDYSIAKNTILEFIKYERDNGSLPYSIKDKEGAQYFQIQECVSFVHLAYIVYTKTLDNDFLNKIYIAGKKYVNYIIKTRVNRYNLVEMFVGYDTGHDNSARLDALDFKQNYKIDGKPQDASIIPNTKHTRVIALDMSANLYANLKYMAKICNILNIKDEEKEYLDKALLVKEDILKYLYDKETNYFYDLDLDNKFNYVKSSSIFHLFQEEVLDKDIDKEMCDNIYNNYLNNTNEFNTLFPIPSVSISDKSRESHKKPNSWGYYSEALTSLRMSLWMDNYGYNKFYDNVLNKWVEGFIKNYDVSPFAQELDPLSGESSGASLWYSTSLLLYMYAVKRLKLIE